MKRTEYFTPRAAARLVLAAACILVLAAACTTDNDPSRPDDDPVPFTFTALAPPAMTDANTRAVPGNDRWKGDSTEKIRVYLRVLTNTSKNSTGIYTVISPDGKTAVLPGDTPALWPSKDEKYSVYAWYPALESEKDYIISDQSTPEKFRQADMLRAEMTDFSYDINFTPDLAFKHQMVKVRVELTGVDASATDIEVGIQGSTSFYLSPIGNVYGYPSPKGYITACRDTKDAGTVAFEAMLPLVLSSPYIIKQNFIRITTGGRTCYFTPGADANDFLSRGELYTYTVTLPSPTATTAAPASHLTLPPGGAVTRARSR